MDEFDLFEEFREKSWTSMDGRSKKIKNLSNEHLANIINWMSKYPKNYTQVTVALMKEECKYRNIPQQYLDGAPYHYDGDENEIRYQIQTRKNIPSVILDEYVRSDLDDILDALLEEDVDDISEILEREHNV